MNTIETINSSSIPRCNFLNYYTLSDYITLVDKKGAPVIFEFNGESCFFTFKKCHFSLNMDNHKNDFKFFEKLYIAGIFKADYKWANILMATFDKTRKKFKPIEPRQFSLEIIDGSPKFFITSYDRVLSLDINT